MYNLTTSNDISLINDDKPDDDYPNDDYPNDYYPDDYYPDDDYSNDDYHNDDIKSTAIAKTLNSVYDSYLNNDYKISQIISTDKDLYCRICALIVSDYDVDTFIRIVDTYIHHAMGKHVVAMYLRNTQIDINMITILIDHGFIEIHGIDFLMPMINDYNTNIWIIENIKFEMLTNALMESVYYKALEANGYQHLFKFIFNQNLSNIYNGVSSALHNLKELVNIIDWDDWIPSIVKHDPAHFKSVINLLEKIDIEMYMQFLSTVKLYKLVAVIKLFVQEFNDLSEYYLHCMIYYYIHLRYE